MPLEWLNAFAQRRPKAPDYAEKTLASYALGMKGRGAIVGVKIEPDPSGCEAARCLRPGEVYDPSSAPRLPLPGCTRGKLCACLYRPVMSYQRSEEP